MFKLLTATLSRRSIVLILCEALLIVSAVALGAFLLVGREQAWLLLQVERGWEKAVIIAVVCQGCLYFADLYDLHRIQDHRDLFVRISQGVGAASLVLAGLYFWLPNLIIGRGVFLFGAVLTIVFVVGWRLVFGWFGKQLAPRERLLLVGTTPSAVLLARELFNQRMELGVDIVGFVDPDPARVGLPLINPGIIGTIEDIPSIVRAHAVDRVVVSLADARGQLPMDKLLEMKLDGISFDHLASLYEEYTGKIAVENLRPSWLVFSSGFKKSRLQRFLKRGSDLLASGIGLLIGAPILALVALAVKITSDGDVLYHQERVGRDGRVFTVHKFRSMRQNAEAATGAVWASKAGDARVTPIGGFLRKTRLDELPQLWNVFVGEMSLVGPRPERPQFVSQLTEQIQFYGQRHIVRPGLTGWAQVRYSYGASVEDAMQKLQYDLFYIKNMSIAFDMFIALSTVKTVIMRRGAA
jgi:sugar transferase (PEP-CTERM system associated)